MAILQTYQSIGNREDLIPIITMISPSQTPILSALKTKKATGMTHEWLTDALASPAANAVVEGADATFGTLTPRVRLNNTIQNIRKTGQVSDNQEAVLKSGVKSEYSYQLEKATKELALDTERALITGSRSTGATATAATMGGILFYTTTNTQNAATAAFTGTAVAVAGTATTITLAVGDGAASGVAIGDQIFLSGGSGQGQYRTITGVAGDVVTVATWDIVPTVTTTYRLYTTPIALTEALVNDSLQAASDAGGEPNCIMVDGKQKRAISAFGQSIRRLTADGQALTNSIDVYESDFGRVSVKYSRWMPAGTVTCLETNKYAVAYLRPVRAEELARTGSSRKFMIESAVTMEALAENASSIIMGAL